MATIRIILRGLVTIVVVFSVIHGQDRSYFKSKLGTSADLYHHKSGVDVVISYDSQGLACTISIYDPSKRRGDFNPNSFKRVKAVAEELIPVAERGRLLNSKGNVGDCIDYQSNEYERVFVFENKDACYDQGIRISFKRGSCPNVERVSENRGRSNNTLDRSGGGVFRNLIGAATLE